MGDCLLAGKPSPSVTGHLGQLSLPSLHSRVGKLHTSPYWLELRQGVVSRCVHLCRVAGNTVWSYMARDTP